MGVMTGSTKKSETEPKAVGKKLKSFEKTRPITATLDHPLILDIKLLKKLDMTTFTKKGLIALSKFCGISLIKRTDSKRKFNKCVKTIQCSRKQLTDADDFGSLSRGQNADECKRDHVRGKRKSVKQIPKLKRRIKLKVIEEGSGVDEDSLDVICKRHDKVILTKSKAKKSGMEGKMGKGDGGAERRAIVDDIFNGTMQNLIPEPCKTCSRSEHPERFHSHPKMSGNPKSRKAVLKTRDFENLKDVPTSKDADRDSGRSSGGSAKENEDSSILDSQVHRSPPGDKDKKISPAKMSILSPTKSSSSTDLDSSEVKTSSKLKKSKKSLAASLPQTKSSVDVQYLKKINVKNGDKDKDVDKLSQILPVNDPMKFLTGCYVCGKQMSPKHRTKHEEGCIVEWRTQNNLLPAEKRKPEPIRPDYRFTASGDLDCEGTFESIWANHMDSLVPCKKCGRKFFPDRIERHENCCNNLPVKFKHNH